MMFSVPFEDVVERLLASVSVMINTVLGYIIAGCDLMFSIALLLTIFG